jgi:hypothetical protein
MYRTDGFCKCGHVHHVSAIQRRGEIVSVIFAECEDVIFHVVGPPTPCPCVGFRGS